MLKDFSMYQDCKRNDHCPCGSGKTFKTCCMKEYREQRKQIKEITILPFSPLKALDSKQKKMVTTLYMELMLYTHRQRTGNTSPIPMDDMRMLIQKEREYFLDDRDHYLSTFRLSRQFDEDENKLLNGLEKSKFGNYIHLSHSDQTAILLDLDENKLFSIKALNDSFDTIFGKKNEFIVIQTILIPFDDRFISDGIYETFKVEEELASIIREWIMDEPPEIHHQEQRTICSGPLIINAAFMAHSNEFEMMENCLLDKISDDFYHDLKELFGESGLHFERIVPIEGFLRSTDLMNESNRLLDEEKTFEEIMLYYGDSIQGESNFIPSNIRDQVYRQPALVDSASGPSMLPKIAHANKNGNSWIMGYFSMVFYISLHEKEFYSWEDWTEELTQNPSERSKIAKLLEEATEKLSHDSGLECRSIFLDVGIEYEIISDAISDFRDTLSKNKFLSMAPKELAIYSTTRSLSNSPYQMIQKALQSMVEDGEKASRRRTNKRMKKTQKSKKKSSFEQPSLFGSDDM